MKYEFDLAEILKMMDDGKMLKDIYTYYGCSRGTLGRFLKKNGLNFQNNPNARRNQSKLMSGPKNPTKGRKRTPEEMRGITRANHIKADLYWENKYKDGITFKQYSKVCRSITPQKMKDECKFNEYEIDHLFSVKDCWENKIHPRYASHVNNLRVISSYENKHKASNSSISIDEFLKRVGVQRLSKAQFNWKRVE